MYFSNTFKCITFCILYLAFNSISFANLDSSECKTSLEKPKHKFSYSNGWGIDYSNTRYQNKSLINKKNADSLKLKWVYGLNHKTPRSYPLITEDTIFIGDNYRGLVALDRETGCERWLYKHDGFFSSAILSGTIEDKKILIFADRFKGIYALDATNGEFIWEAKVTDEILPMYSGTPLVVKDKVFVPVASMEVTLAMNYFYGCCKSSGGMAAFDLKSGELLWYLPTIKEEAALINSHFWFVQEYGPSGAPVWSSPSYDYELDWIFFGTGQNYSHPTTNTSDAIFAVDAEDGSIIWIRQYTKNDLYTAACNISENHPNCANPMGLDVDFGAPTILTKSLSGQKLLIAGQKSAEIHAMDRFTGKPLWTKKLGQGGIIGGVHWGLAVNEALSLLYVPISDKEALGFTYPGESKPGLYALDISTGDNKWKYSRSSRCDDIECTYGLSGAIIATNDIVVSGSMDGFIEILSADKGKLLWSFDSWRDFDSINGVATNGGAFDAHGPMVADDLLMITSGYSYVGSQKGGNAFLVFQLEQEN